MSLKNPRNSKALRKELRQNMTEAESALWEKLRKKSLGVRVKRQYGIGPYILDFYIPKIRLAIEVDGGIHQNPEVKEKDENRDAFLRRNGIEVLRFTNNEVLNKMDKVLSEVKKITESKIDRYPILSDLFFFLLQQGERRVDKTQNHEFTSQPL